MRSAVTRTARAFLASLASLIVPPRRLPVAAWLDEHRVISKDYPSPFPGPWRTSRTPYLRDVLNDFTDPAVETLVLMFSSQIGKTEALFGMMMYAYGVDPGPGMMVLPTLDLAGAVSTDRAAPALRTCAVLNVGSQKSRATDNAILHKRINGLPLTFAGANSTPSLSSRPVRYLFADEIDRWPGTTPEGDPLSLVQQRAAAYRRRKKVYTSTPTVKGASRIEEQYENSDRRELFAPCPRCGARFVVRWSHVRWEPGEPDTAHLVHDVERDREGNEVGFGCGGRIEDTERRTMFAAAEWRATAPFAGTRGYHTWAVVSPWTTLSEIVDSFLKAKGKPETLQAWINLTLGESWEVPSEKVETASLLMRRQEYVAEVPAGARVLTCGVDTQDDRLEALVVGWGPVGPPHEESWVVARESFYGDPQKPEVWLELDELILRAWRRELGGTTRVQCTLVDALGHRTTSVYSAIIPRQGRRVFASIGKDGVADGQLVSQPKALETSQGNVMRYIVDASQAKALIYSRLRIEEKAGPGVVHFPMSVGDAFFTELTSEHLVTERNRFGVPSKRWAMRPGHRRNEALDCFGMALAAFRAICPSGPKFEELAAKLDQAADAAMAGASAPPAVRQPRTRNWRGGV